MLRGMAVLARIQEEANREWEQRFNRMTLGEKRVELSQAINFPFYAAGLNALMLVILPVFVLSILIGYREWMLVATAIAIFLAGTGPVAGLHWGTHARLAKKYGVYLRTTEHTALDVLFCVMAVLALEVYFNYANSLEVNLALLVIAIVVQVILFRWAFFGRGPIKPLSTAPSK